MKQGDRAEFGYNILIPENLDYNQTLFSTYQVNYYIDNQLITEISSIGAELQSNIDLISPQYPINLGIRGGYETLTNSPFAELLFSISISL